MWKYFLPMSETVLYVICHNISVHIIAPLIIIIYIVPFAKVMCIYNSASHSNSRRLNLDVGDHYKLLVSNISVRNCFLQFTGSVVLQHTFGCVQFLTLKYICLACFIDSIIGYGCQCIGHVKDINIKNIKCLETVIYILLFSSREPFFF